MTISLTIILYMILGAILATLLYTIIGIIPGTDETAVIVPVTAVLVALNVPLLVTLTFFIASIVTMNITVSIPTALTSIPGGVMATPFIDSSLYLKEQGKTTLSLRKMLMGSLIGTIVTIPISLMIVLIVHLITKYSGIDINYYIKLYVNEIFFVGAIALALLSKEKFISLLAILPYGFIILLTKYLHPIKDISKVPLTPFFLAITVGPLIYNLFELMFKKTREKNTVYGNKNIEIEINKNEKIVLKDILTKEEKIKSVIATFFSTITFFLSPVAMTLLIGDSLTQTMEDEEEKSFMRVTIMNAISNSAYLGGVIISLLIFKLPISPAALGPGSVIFDESNGFLNLTTFNSLIAIIIGVLVALSITVYLGLKVAPQLTKFVFKYISQESILILLIGIFILIVFLDSSFMGLLIYTPFALISGYLNKKGVNFGVQFMTLYASGYILKLFGMF